MNTKLTLRLDEAVIQRTKKYALRNNVSVSRLVESYLDSITKKRTGTFEITPLVQSISGVAKAGREYDYKEDYRKHISEKYK